VKKIGIEDVQQIISGETGSIAAIENASMLVK
jgi:hypothetical protein